MLLSQGHTGGKQMAEGYVATKRTLKYLETSMQTLKKISL